MSCNVEDKVTREILARGQGLQVLDGDFLSVAMHTLGIMGWSTWQKFKCQKPGGVSKWWNIFRGFL